MVADNYRTQLVRWASGIAEIVLVAMTGERVNSAVVQNPLHSYDFVLALKEETKLDFTTISETKLIQDAFLGMKEDVSRFRLLYADRTYVNIAVTTEENFDRLLTKDSLMDIVLDKGHRYGPRGKATDLSYREKPMACSEYTEKCHLFYAEMTDACMYLYNNDLLSAQLALERGREALLWMVRGMCAFRSDYTVNLGKDLRNLSAYLEPGLYELLKSCYAKTEREAIWDSLFKSCMLFRKAGLLVAEAEDFEYPREMDVEVLKLFRTMWEEVR